MEGFLRNKTTAGKTPDLLVEAEPTAKFLGEATNDSRSPKHPNFTRQWQKETQQIQVCHTHCLFHTIPRFSRLPPISPQSTMLTCTNCFYTENKTTKSGKSGNAEAKAHLSAKAALKGVS